MALANVSTGALYNALPAALPMRPFATGAIIGGAAGLVNTVLGGSAYSTKGTWLDVGGVMGNIEDWFGQQAGIGIPAVVTGAAASLVTRAAGMPLTSNTGAAVVLGTAAVTSSLPTLIRNVV